MTKSHFFHKSLRFLGYMVFVARVQVDPNKTKAVREYKVLKNLKSLKWFFRNGWVVPRVCMKCLSNSRATQHPQEVRQKVQVDHGMSDCLWNPQAPSGDNSYAWSTELQPTFCDLHWCQWSWPWQSWKKLFHHQTWVLDCCKSLRKVEVFPWKEVLHWGNWPFLTYFSFQDPKIQHQTDSVGIVKFEKYRKGKYNTIPNTLPRAPGETTSFSICQMRSYGRPNRWTSCLRRSYTSLSSKRVKLL